MAPDGDRGAGLSGSRRLVGLLFLAGAVVLLVVVVDQLAADGALDEPDLDVRRDLDGHRLVVDLADRPEDATDRHDLVVHLDALDERALLALAPLLRADEEEVEHPDHGDQEEDEREAAPARGRGREGGKGSEHEGLLARAPPDRWRR